MQADGELRFFYQLAIRMGKSVREIMDFPIEELRGFMALLALEHEEQQKEG